MRRTEPTTLTLPAPHRGSDRAMLAGVVAAEGAIVALGIASGNLLGASLLALGIAYALVAYRFPEVAWSLVWVCVPLSMEHLLPSGSAITLPTEPMIVLALAAWSLRLLVLGGSPIRSSPLHLPLALLAAAALVSIALGSDITAGVKAWVVSAGYVAFGYLYFFMAPCSPGRRDRWLRLIVLTGALCGLYGAVRVLSQGIALRYGYVIGRPFFPNHGSYGAYLAMLFPLALLLAAEVRGRTRWMYVTAALLMASGLLLSFSRATWLSLLIVLPFLVLGWTARTGSWRPATLLASFTLAATVAMLALGASPRITRHVASVGQAENMSNLERVNRWMAAVEMARDRPWLGVGYGAYRSVYPQYRRKAIVTEQSLEPMATHSELLRILAETGWVGLALAVGFLAVVFRTGFAAFRRASDPARRLVAWGVLGGLATYCVHGIVDSYLGVDKITVPFWSAIGAIAALALSPPAEPRSER